MRFTTTGSTLTNTFIIFTVVLLSLIPVSNASLYLRQDNDATISKISSKYLDAVIFTNPKQGSVYNPGDEVEVKWSVTEETQEVRNGTTGDIYLKNDDIGYNYELQQGVVIKTYSLNTTFPVDNVLPSESYYIKIQSPLGGWRSSFNFTIL